MWVGHGFDWAAASVCAAGDNETVARGDNETRHDNETEQGGSAADWRAGDDVIRAAEAASGEAEGMSDKSAAAVISVWADGRDGREGGGSKGAYNRPSYPCHYCTYRGGLLWQGAVDKAKADDQRHAGERQHHHLQARKAVGGKQRKIIHHTLPKRRSQEVRD